MTHVAPPHLNLLHGIVKKQSHSLDLHMAKYLGKERTTNSTVMTVQLHSYVSSYKIIHRKKEEKEKLKKKGS